jgi:Fe-S cluster assembly protein SufD
MSRDLDNLLRLAPDESSSWIGATRQGALTAFEEQGLPTRRLESWKGTSLGPLAAMQFSRVGPGETTVAPDVPGPGLVFVDGRLDPESSETKALPRGIRAISLREALESEPELLKTKLGRLADPKRHALVALQTAFLEDGAVVLIESGTKSTQPLRIRLLSTADETGASASFPRLLVVAGEGSEATITLEHDSVGSAPGLTALVAEFHLGAASRIESVQVQAEDAARIHFTSLHARLERDARFSSHVFSLGGGLTRSEVELDLAEPGAEAGLEGLFVGRGQGHIDHFTTVRHAAEDCTSDQEYRGVLGDNARGVFRGRVIVDPGAQRTNARQSNPNLLLSDNASIDTKPQLEIYADDIRASHGSTIGQLDADALFFLRARGIDDASAKLMLTNAFARSIVDRIGSDELENVVGARVEATLARLGDASAEEAT